MSHKGGQTMMMKIALLGFLVTLSLTAVAQVEPAATGPSRPSGNLNYSLRDSQIAWWSGVLGDQQANALSGSLQYENGKTRNPLSVNYSGGYTFVLTGATFGTGYFQNLSIGDTFSGRKWRLRLSDGISYRPQAPTFGFSGVAGTGEPPTPPPVTGTPTETVLTENTHAINNVTTASYTMPINFAVSFLASGSYAILRYPDGNGYDSTAISGDVGASLRLSGRTSLTGEFEESRFGFGGGSGTFETSAVLGSVSHTFNKSFRATFSAGPAWVTSQGISNFPSSTTVFLSGGLNYHKRFDTISINGYHGDNSGSGVFYGARFNSIGANYSREIEKKTTLSVNFGFQQNSGLQVNTGSSSGLFGSVSAARRLGRLFSLSAAYTATEQTANSLPGNVLNGLLQGASVSIGYSPRGIRGIEQ